jgi:GMP synthase (glutamine-hydrolysing)
VKRAVFLQHLHRETPGLIADVCRERGLAVEIRSLDLGIPVPASLTVDELLVVMGGSMNVGDLADPRYPFLAKELELLRKVLADRQPVLGVCLGAQLLAHAAGSAVYPNRQADPGGGFRLVREVGFGEVRLLGREREPVLAGLPASIPVLHWHGQTFDLPAGATHLAESDACKHQAFRIGRHAFGLQFHVEADAEMARQWAVEDADFVVSALGVCGPSTIIAMSDATAAAAQELGKRLIGNILDEMLSPP